MKSILEKREQIRSKIRKDILETTFKKKRITQTTSDSKYFEINKQMSANIENTSLQLVQNQNLMNELMQSTDESALLLLANACASEKLNVINYLVQTYKLHEYFMRKIQVTQGDLTTVTIKSYSGLTNLLFSQPQLAQIVKEYLFGEKIYQFVYLSVKEIDRTDNKDWIGPILRLLYGLIGRVQSNQFPKQCLIGIIEIVFKWIKYTNQSIDVIRSATYICNELLECINEETLDKILLKILNIEDGYSHKYIQLIDDLFVTSNETLVINYLDNSRIDEVIKFALTSRSVELSGAALVFLYNRVVNRNSSMQQFVLQFYTDIINVSRISFNQGIIEKCLLIMQELYENDQLNDQEQGLFDYLFEVLKNRVMLFDYQNCIEAAKLLLQLQISNQREFDKHQQNILDTLNNSKSDELEDLLTQIFSVSS